MSNLVPRDFQVPEKYTQYIPLKAELEDSKPSPPEIKVTVNYAMPDEMKLVMMVSLVAVMCWMMLTVFVSSFSKPQVIIIDSGQVYD